MSRRAIAVVIGIGVAFAYLILTGFPFSKYFGNLQYVFFSPSAQDDYDHPVEELLQLYVKSIIDSVISFWPILVSLILLLAFSILISRYRRTLLPLLWPLSALMVIISLFAALSWSREFNWPLLGTVLVFLSLLLSGMFLAVIDWDPSSFSGSRFLDQTKSSKNSRFQIFILLGVIIGAPLAAAVGTNNPIAGQMIFSATIWVTISVGFLLVLSNRLLLWQNVPLAFGLQGIYAVLAMVVLLAFAHDLLKAPYRTQIYSTQNSNTDAHYLAGLKLLSSQSNWANWISKSADDLNAQDVPTVAINSPGVLLAFNNSGLASPWVSSFWPVSAKSVSLGCSSLAEKPKDFFVLQDGHVGVQDNWDYTVSLEILKCGFEFPRDFEIVAQHTSAVVQDGKTTIWRVKTP